MSPRALAFVLLVMTAAPAAVDAQSLPAELAAAEPVLRERGAGRFRYWGFHVYDARLWDAGERFDVAGRFALGLRYAREFAGEEIGRSSIEEIRRLGLATPLENTRWTALLASLFPAVKRGDEIVGVHLPGFGARFFHNGKPIGEVADPAFARAFFAIWLDPRTRGSDLRRALLGERDERG